MSLQAIESLSDTTHTQESDPPIVLFRSYSGHIADSTTMSQSAILLMQQWDVPAILTAQLATPPYSETVLLTYSQANGTGRSRGLLRSQPLVGGIILENAKEAVMVMHGNRPLVVLYSKQYPGPVAVLSITLESLVPSNGGESIITLCLRRYLQEWGGPDAVKVDFIGDNHHVPRPNSSHEKRIASSCDEKYDVHHLISDKGVNVAIILASQLSGYGIFSGRILDPQFRNKGEVSFIVRNR